MPLEVERGAYKKLSSNLHKVIYAVGEYRLLYSVLESILMFRRFQLISNYVEQINKKLGIGILNNQYRNISLS